MRLVKSAITLTNDRQPGKSIVETALVDTGALLLTIPEWTARELGFDLNERQPKTATLADGSKITAPYVGPALVSFAENRTSLCGALVMGNEIQLGAIPMEEMDVLVHPTKQVLMPNPESPDYPIVTLKGLNAIE